MKAFDKPGMYLMSRIAYDSLFERRPCFITKRNDYYQMESVYPYKWGNRFINKNRIKKEI